MRNTNSRGGNELVVRIDRTGNTDLNWNQVLNGDGMDPQAYTQYLQMQQLQ